MRILEEGLGYDIKHPREGGLLKEDLPAPLKDLLSFWALQSPPLGLASQKWASTKEELARQLT